MSFFLMHQGENGLQDKFENIIKRIVLNSAHLLNILAKIEFKFGTIQKSVRGGTSFTIILTNSKKKLKKLWKKSHPY